MNFTLDDHLWNMSLALEQAEQAYKLGEVPVGAVLCDSAGKIIAKGYNLKETNHDPCSHAEINTLREGAKAQNNWRLNEHILYVTLEPCLMCLGAMVHARIDMLVFGAYDPKAGAISLGNHAYKDKRLNHQFAVVGGIKHLDCSKLLSGFFRERREGFLNQ